MTDHNPRCIICGDIGFAKPAGRSGWLCHLCWKKSKEPTK